LNSNVYRARAALIIFIPFADCQLRDTFRGGKISLPLETELEPVCHPGSVMDIPGH
jgi:hypothetical protein